MTSPAVFISYSHDSDEHRAWVLMQAPKLFVSYSWTTPDHEAWVLRLATDLRESGVDVILDKWDLKEGHDANAFMEKMVSDPEVKKVLMVCDKAYVDKTDGRKGGVGTEAQIISAEIYRSQAQDKFVAVVRERDEAGKAYLPVYYRSRIYIDMSDPATSAENFERLLRWVFGQPLHEKPALGQKPAYLSEAERAVALGTSARWKRAVDALKSNREHAIAACTEYLTLLAEELDKFRLDPKAEPFDDAVVKSIEAFLPYRNEAIELFLALALYRDGEEARQMVHRFFESLISYLSRPANVTTWNEWNFDNFRFIVHELFLYALAAFAFNQRFESASYLMGSEYYVPGNSDYGRNVMVSFEVFSQYLRSLEHRNQRLEKKRLSLHADLLEQRCKELGVEFRHVMQADFILFMRSNLDEAENRRNWWPLTLLYVGRHSGPFEVFARSRSAAYFERAKVLLGVKSKGDLEPLMTQFANRQRPVPSWQFESFNPAALLGFNDLASKL